MSQSSSSRDSQCDFEQVPPWSWVPDSLPHLLRRFSFLCVIAWELSSFLGRTGSPSLMRPRPDAAVPPFRLRPHTIHPSPGVEELAGGSWHFGGTGSGTGWGLRSCARNTAALGRTCLVMSGPWPWDPQTSLTPFGTGWSEAFVMTAFANVSRLYVAPACFRQLNQPVI